MKSFEELKNLAEKQIRRTMASLPEGLHPVAGIPVILEKFPSPRDVEEGIDGDVLGLFVGPSVDEAEIGSFNEASHIILYLENIWDYADEDEDLFIEEIEVTLLHELGHYLNLDEDDLEDRGLG